MRKGVVSPFKEKHLPKLKDYPYMITSSTTNDHHQEGEAIATSIQNKLGPSYSVTYNEEKQQWEIAIASLIFGSFRRTEQGWVSNLNPAIAHNVSRAIGVVVDWALERANKRAIGSTQEAR